MNKIILTLLAALPLFASCARTISSDTYSADHVGEASRAYTGVVISTRNINVQDGERLQDNGMGIAGGGIGGALIGSTIGRGSGNMVATIGGALVGATAGAFAEKSLKNQPGIEYIVALDDGRALTVVQAPVPTLYEGQRVFVIVSHDGRSRVVAAPGR